MKQDKKNKDNQFPLQERLSQRELQELMGMFKPTYKRINGKIRRK